jgi:dipeptidyl aminopeptidase/acylaminoacyl peptidase
VNVRSFCLRESGNKELLLFLAAVVFLLGAHDRTLAQDVQRLESPDGTIVAIITSSGKRPSLFESQVELRSKSGREIVRKGYHSDDGNHGYGVSNAEWTPDSQFFVYSLESSGGHSPWHSPVDFFSRKSAKISSLDDELHDSVMNPMFKIDPPDTVTVELWFSKTGRKVSLSSLAPEDAR